MFAIPGSRLLIAGVIAAFIGLGSYMLQVDDGERASMAISPDRAVSTEGGEIIVDVIVISPIPVNAFAGTVTFNPERLEVASIDYNNSIADLWAETPWYENGDGTVTFAGGSTRPGGFTGEGSLITITFRSKGPGESSVEIISAQILQHDGLGTDAPLATPIEAIFTITADVAPATPITSPTADVVISPKETPIDLNDDGKQSIADVSILMQHMITGDLSGDVNSDGRVSIADLSIILDSL